MPLGETIGRAYVKILADGKDFARSVKQEVDAHAAEIGKSGKDASGSFRKGWEDEDRDWLDKHMDRLRARIEKNQGKFVKAGNVLGKAFGKGSRNDFLNAFGGFISLGPRLIGALGGIGTAFTDMVKKVNAATRDADAFKKALVNLASEGLPGLIAAASVVAITVSTVMATLGPFGAAISLLTGLVLALAGSLGFALAGGVIAAAGAMVPFAAALGVVAIALQGISEKTPGVKALTDQWNKLAKATAQDIFGKQGEGFAALQDVLTAVEPLISSVAGAVGDLLVSMGKAVQGKGFTDLIGTIAKILPPMIETLGKIGGNLFVGIGQAFVAAEPIITEFLGWLEDISAKFVEAGEGGKKSDLAGFFERAWESAKKVGAFIGELIGLVGDLLGAGKETGDDIFTTLTEQVKKIRDWLADPANQDALKQWFEDAKKLGAKLGEIVESAGKFIDALDTPASRAALLIILGIINDILKAATWVATTFDDLGTALSDFVSDMSASWTAMWDGLAADVGEFIEGVKQFFIDFWDWLVGNSLIPDLIDEIVRLFATLPGRIGAGLGDLTGRFVQWVKGVPAKFTALVASIIRSFINLAAQIIAKAGNLAARFATWVSSLPGKAKTIATQIAAGFANLAGKIIDRAGSISAKVTTWLSSLPGKARGAADKIANAFSGLAGDMISAAGSIAARVSDWLSGLYSKGKNAGDDIARGFRDALSGLLSNISLGSLNISAAVQRILDKYTASGGIFLGAQTRIIGEAGPEAVVPLSRPLSMVDPAVRELSAFAQGKLSTPARSSGRTIDVGGITVITPAEDPRAVASEVVARMAAAAYI